MGCRGCEDQCHCTVVAGNGSVSVTGSGTAVSPYTVSARASASSGNALSVRPDGLYVPTSSVPGTWTTYTPTWTLQGTVTANPTVGNGTLIGKYARIGNIVFLKITLTFGTTTTPGAGDVNTAWAFSAPVAAANFTSSRDTGSAGALHNGVGAARWDGTALFNTTTSIVVPMHATARHWGPVTPDGITWGTNDQMRLSITYEAAS